MEFLLLLMLFIFLLVVMSAPKPAEVDELLRASKKQCPPHKWGYQKVLNEDGTVDREHIVCANCGPLRPYTRPTND